MKGMVIFGATSAIAQAVARELAPRGVCFQLVGRREKELEILAEDLRARGSGNADILVADSGDASCHEELLSQVFSRQPEVDAALIAYGSLGDQAAGEADFAVAEQQIRTNFTSAVSLLTRLANRFEERGQGNLIVISSVAGDRGRKSNYIYGAAKAALTTFCAGLRHRLHRKNVQVLTVKPGFVDTPMTAHLKKGPLFATPEIVGRAIVRASDRGAHIVYVPWFWRGIMAIIRSIPETIFLRTNI